MEAERASEARVEWDSGSMHVTRHAIGATNQESGRWRNAIDKENSSAIIKVENRGQITQILISSRTLFCHENTLKNDSVPLIKSPKYEIEDCGR